MKTRTFTAVVVLLAVAATIFTAIGIQWANRVDASGASPSYLAQVFPAGEVIQINVEIDQTDWQEMLANPTAEQYYAATVQLAGQTVQNIGFRIKGNSSLSSVARSDSDRYSFKIDFDQYVDGQTLLGLTKLNLNNNFSDPSSMREYLAYQAFNELGVPTPATVYANVCINGQLQGLYLAVEGIESPFLERSYGEALGELYKPEGTGADLAWRGESPNSYPGIIDQNKNVQSDNQQLIAFLRALDSGEDLEAYLDVDATLRYFAVSTALANFDSYQGQMLHNYYLYNHNGQFVILPWDLNMAFGGFGGVSGVLIDEPTMGALSSRPLIAKLLAVPEYLDRYHSYLETVATSFLSEERMELAVLQLDELIRPYIAADPTKFYTLDQYEAGFSGENGLISYANTLATSIVQQLSGASPSTNNGQGSASGRNGFGGFGGFGNIDGQQQARGTAANQDGPPEAGHANNPNGLPAGRDNTNPGDVPAGGEAVIDPRTNQPGAGFSLPQGMDMETLQPIIEEARNGELSTESKDRLLELGLSEEMIERLANRQGVDGAMPNNPIAGDWQPGQMGERRNGADSALAEQYGIFLATGLMLLLLTLSVCLLRIRRRKFVS